MTAVRGKKWVFSSQCLDCSVITLGLKLYCTCSVFNVFLFPGCNLRWVITTDTSVSTMKAVYRDLKSFLEGEGDRLCLLASQAKSCKNSEWNNKNTVFHTSLQFAADAVAAFCAHTRPIQVGGKSHARPGLRAYDFACCHYITPRPNSKHQLDRLPWLVCFWTCEWRVYALVLHASSVLCEPSSGFAEPWICCVCVLSQSS